MSEADLLLQEWADPATSAERKGEISVALAERINNSGAEVKVVVGGEELVFVPHWWDEDNPFYKDVGKNPKSGAFYQWGQYVSYDLVLGRPHNLR